MKKQLLLIIGIFLFGINSSFSSCKLPSNQNTYFIGSIAEADFGIGANGNLTLASVILAPLLMGAAGHGIAVAADGAVTGTMGALMGAGGYFLVPLALHGSIKLVKVLRKNRKKASSRLIQGNVGSLKAEFKKNFEKFKRRNKKLKGIDDLTIGEFAYIINKLSRNGGLCNKRGLYLDKSKIFKKVAEYIKSDKFRDARLLVKSGEYYKSNRSFTPDKFIDPRTSKCYLKDDENLLLEIEDLEDECLGPQIIANPTNGGYYCGNARYETDENGNKKLHIRAINTSLSTTEKNISKVCAGVIQDEERRIKNSCNHLKLRLQIKYDEKNKVIDENAEKLKICLHSETAIRSDEQAAFNLCKDTEYEELGLAAAKEEMGALYDELKSDLYLKNLMVSYAEDKELLGPIKTLIQEKFEGRSRALKLDDSLRISLDVKSKKGFIFGRGPLAKYTIYFDSSNKLQLDEDLKYDSKCIDPDSKGSPREICSERHPQESKVDFEKFAMNAIGEGCIETKYQYIKRFTVSSNEQKEIASKNRKSGNQTKASKR